MKNYSAALESLSEEVRRIKRGGFHPGCCFYCGDAAFGGGDHVIPHSFRHNRKTARQWRDAILPCCFECNATLGSAVFDSISLRMAHLAARIAGKYAKLKAMPVWSAREVNELGYALGSAVNQLATLQTVVTARLMNLRRKSTVPAKPVQFVLNGLVSPDLQIDVLNGKSLKTGRFVPAKRGVSSCLMPGCVCRSTPK